MKFIKYPLLLLLFVFAISCAKESQEEEEENKVVLLCDNDPFQISIESNGITMNSDSCWVVFYEDPISAGLSDNFPAVIKWEYPGYPEWNGANSFTFYYQTDTIKSGQTYDAKNIIGVIEFDGSDGQMFTNLGEEGILVDVLEYNAVSKYICGTFSGKAIINDNLPVDINGSFKGVLNP